MDTGKLIREIELKQMELKKLQNKLFLKEREQFSNTVLNQKITDRWSMYQGDCVEVIKNLPDESIHYSIFSPPFLSLYVYSDDYRDMGNSKTDKDFYTHFEYIIPELLRVIKPGRLVTIHCSVINKSIQNDGIMGLKDLPGSIVYLFEKHGWVYHSKVMVWKDPLIQAVRTKSLSLAHKQIIKDSTRCGVGFGDELLTFRKPGLNSEPVAHGRGFEQYIGEMPEPVENKNDDPKINKYSHNVWQRYASPVWFDINQGNTLNVRIGRDKKDEKHICPLQLTVISRCLEMWTNENDIVLSPFAGIGSEGYESLLRNRRFIGVELKDSYYIQALKNLKAAEKNTKPIF
jgi:DNA modification methylase